MRNISIAFALFYGSTWYEVSLESIKNGNEVAKNRNDMRIEIFQIPHQFIISIYFEGSYVLSVRTEIVTLDDYRMFSTKCLFKFYHFKSVIVCDIRFGLC